MYGYCVCVVSCSRKERLCNTCVAELKRDTTSECEDTDSELGTSPPQDTSPVLDNARDSSPVLDNARDTSPGLDNAHDSSPVSDNTLEEQHDTITTEDSLLSVPDSVVHADDLPSSNADEDGVMSQSAPAAYNNATWSMRGTAYSALSWMSGVMSRSLVRPPVTNGRPAVDDDTADLSEANVTALTRDENDADAEPADVTDANVTLTDVDVNLTADHSPSDGADNTANSVTQCDISHDLATSELGRCLLPDTVQRYIHVSVIFVYFHTQWMLCLSKVISLLVP